MRHVLVFPPLLTAILALPVAAGAGLRDKFPGSAITLSRSAGPDGGAALTLRWKDIWKSGAGCERQVSDGRLSRDVMPDLLHPNQQG